MVVDALDTHSHGVDSAATRRIAEERNQNKPQDWAAIAEQFVEVRCASGWRSNYNHAVYVTTGLAAPGRQGKKIGDIICVSDSSGSIGKEAWQKFFELNQYILDDIQPDRMLLISCAEEVKDHTILEAGDTVPTKMTGGGGTSFKAAFDWIKEDPEDLCIEPLLLIYFTDGLCEDHKRMQEPEYPVLWLSYHKEKSGFPWGEFAKISVK
jgi:predicted metal-dependent peptidase